MKPHTQSTVEIAAIILIMENFNDIPEETTERVIKLVEKIQSSIPASTDFSAEYLLNELFEKYGV